MKKKKKAFALEEYVKANRKGSPGSGNREPRTSCVLQPGTRIEKGL